VNCIAAGGVKSDMYYENSRKYLPGGDALSWEEIDARIAAWSPLGRVGVPEDVVGVVALLASEEAGWITGQTLHVSGGAHMGTA
jgi:tetrahydroxynaphthalene reductase